MSHTTRVISIGQLNVEPGSGYFATLAQSFLQPEHTISRVPRDTDAAIVTNVALGLHVYYLEVVVLAEGATADEIDARRRALLREFDPTRGPVTVVIENQTGTARRRFMQFVARKVDQMESHNGKGFAVALEAYDDVRWRAVDAEVVTWALDESGAESLTVEGDLEVYPTYTVTPNSAKTAPNWPYSRPVLIEWRSDYGGSHPLDVTGGGLDTAALLTAGKITDESNIAVMMNGAIRRHFYQPDGFSTSFGEAQTQIWIDMTFQPAARPSLAGFVSAAAVTWPVIGDSGLPQAGTLKVDSEIVNYTSRAAGYLYGITRGQWGTTAADHTAGELITHYQGVGWILYGPDAVTPEDMKSETYRNAVAPVFLAPGSDNAEWKYNDFAGANAPGSWTYASWLNDLGFVKESDNNGSFDSAKTYPWNAIGLKAGWTSASTYRLRTAVPIKQTRILGKRIARFSPASSPNSPSLKAWTENSSAGVTVWSSGDGVTNVGNMPFDRTSADIRPEAGQGYNKLLWQVMQNSYVQADIQTMYVTFDDTQTPVITTAGEQTDYDLNMTIANITTGESLTAQFPNMAPGESLVIDSEYQTVTYSLDGSNQYPTVRRDATRSRFLRLVPGVNNFQITEAGMGEMEIAVAYRPRWYA